MALEYCVVIVWCARREQLLAAVVACDCSDVASGGCARRLSFSVLMSSASQIPDPCVGCQPINVPSVMCVCVRISILSWNGARVRYMEQHNKKLEERRRKKAASPRGQDRGVPRAIPR